MIMIPLLIMNSMLMMVTITIIAIIMIKVMTITSLCDRKKHRVWGEY